MGRGRVFWIGVAIATGLWLSVAWGYQVHSLTRTPGLQQGRGEQRPRARCNQGPDLQITQIRLEPESPGIGQSYNVHVGIRNDGNQVASDSWAHLYINRAPGGDPDLQAYAPTAGLAYDASIEAHFTVTEAYAFAGWHTLSVRIDARDDVREACGGEGNNDGATSFEIQQVYPTNTPQPTSTPFPPPAILFFNASSSTVAYGDAVSFQWQVSGQAVTVYLDGELMPLVHTHTVYPTEDHVYILRAENPGGVVQESSRITMVEPTETPTLTATPCAFPVIHEFGASPSSVVRGEKVTLYWDVSGAREVFLNGDGVQGVSAQTFRLDQTVQFELLARNECGEVSETLTVQARYATPTHTPVPTLTRTPTRTSTPTYTPRAPTATPTRNVLSTPVRTSTPVQGTATATLDAFQSPLGTGTATLTPTSFPAVTATSTPAGTMTNTPAVTVAPTWTVTEVPTLIPTETPAPTLTSTPAPPVETSTVVVTETPAPGGGVVATATVPPSPASPTLTATPGRGSAGGSLRGYICPLSVLLVFAIGVLVLSIVLPRIQERRQGIDAYQHAVSAYGVVSENGSDGQEGEPEAEAPEPPRIKEPRSGAEARQQAEEAT